MAGAVMAATVMVCSFASVPTADAATLKIATYGTSGDDQYTVVTRLADGSFAATGYTYNRKTNGWRTYLAKYDDRGSRLWLKDIPSGIEPYYVVQSGTDIVVADDVYRVVTFSSSGKKLWSKTLAHSASPSCSSDYLAGFARFGKGYIALASCGDFVNDTEIPLVVTYGSTGKQQSAKYLPDGLFDRADVLVPTGDGGYIIGGVRTIEQPAPCQDACRNSRPALAKFTAAGDLVWDFVDEQAAPSDSSGAIKAITPLAAGGYAVLAERDDPETEAYEALVMRFDESGHRLWSATGTGCVANRVYHPTGQLVEADGGIVTIGQDRSALCKWDANGALTWTVPYKRVTFQSIVSDGHAGLVAVGSATKSAPNVQGNRGGADAVIGHFGADGQLSTWPGKNPFAHTHAPTITGTAKVGRTLSAKVTKWSPTASLSWQWYRSNAPIAGATHSTYRLVAADKGAKITVKVTGSRAGYKTATRTSKPTRTVAAGSLSSTPTPKISGTRKVGSVLTAVPGIWKPAGVTLSYQWYRGSSRIPGATSSDYQLTGTDAGKTSKLRVTGSLAGYKSVSKTSKATGRVAAS